MVLGKPLNVLIVEDEALLAMELESLIEDCGHKVVGWAPSEREARRLVDEVDADLAFLDVHLQDGPTGLEIARYLNDKPCLVVFLTANPKRIPDDFLGACGVIAKPYTVSSLIGCINYIEEGIRTPPPQGARPLGLTLSPRYSRDWDG